MNMYWVIRTLWTHILRFEVHVIVSNLEVSAEQSGQIFNFEVPIVVLVVQNSSTAVTRGIPVCSSGTAQQSATEAKQTGCFYDKLLKLYPWYHKIFEWSKYSLASTIWRYSFSDGTTVWKVQYKSRLWPTCPVRNSSGQGEWMSLSFASLHHTHNDFKHRRRIWVRSV